MPDRHRANGGETRLSNLATLCRFHHRQVHEGGVTIEIANDGALRFVTKDGPSFLSPLPARPGGEQGSPADDVLQGDWTQLLVEHNSTGLTINPNTAVTRWGGESMDYGIAVGALLHHARHATCSAASTTH